MRAFWKGIPRNRFRCVIARIPSDRFRDRVFFAVFRYSRSPKPASVSGDASMGLVVIAGFEFKESTIMASDCFRHSWWPSVLVKNIKGDKKSKKKKKKRWEKKRIKRLGEFLLSHLNVRDPRFRDFFCFDIDSPVFFLEFVFFLPSLCFLYFSLQKQ